MRGPRRFQQGRAEIWTPIVILLAIVGLYGTITYAPIYITAYQVRQTFATVANQYSHLSDDELAAELKRRFEPMKPPFPLDSIAITRVGTTIIMDVQYDVEIRHPFMEPYIIHMNPHVERTATN